MYIIFVENAAGDIVRAMTWSGKKDEGIAVAKIDAQTRNIPVRRIWGEFVKTKATEK